MNRNNRIEQAAQTLEIIKNGMYLCNNQKIDVSKQIEFAVQHSFTLSPQESDDLISKAQNTNNDKFTSEIKVFNCRTIEAIHQENGKLKIGVLNFASAKNPGGGFLGGASAQEESLARSSSLFAAIKDSEMYAFNRSKSTLLYSDYMIYSPGIVFWMDDEANLLKTPLIADVITSPAPNKGAILQNNSKEDLKDLEETFRRRMRKVLALALDQKVECLILGAWGCGVFRNEYQDVAHYFAEIIESEFKNRFRKIFFAVFDSSEKKAGYNAFKNTFEIVGT